MPRPKQRTPELRDRLLAATIELLAEEGVSGVSTRRVAARAGAHAPAIYELFDDKAGLVRAVFFEGFARLGDALDALDPPAGTAHDVIAAVEVLRSFTQDNPELFAVMYSRPFADFSPTPDEQALGDRTRTDLVERVRACTTSGALVGDPVDIAHAVLALAIGLATQEVGGWLGPTPDDRDRRWSHATWALLRGYAPNTPSGA